MNSVFNFSVRQVLTDWAWGDGTEKAFIFISSNPSVCLPIHPSLNHEFLVFGTKRTQFLTFCSGRS